MSNPEARASRYIASLRPAMHTEARRIALEHLARNENIADARAILAVLDTA
jgi:hypothetical protein